MTRQQRLCDFIPAASLLHQYSSCELPARVNLEEWLPCTSTDSQLYRLCEDVFTVQKQTCRINAPFLQVSVMTQSSTRFRGFCRESCSLPVHVVRNTRLATRETDGNQDCYILSRETDGNQDSALSYIRTTKKIKGGVTWISWADFILKHESFSIQAWHKTHLSDLKVSKQSQKIWKWTITYI